MKVLCKPLVAQYICLFCDRGTVSGHAMLLLMATHIHNANRNNFKRSANIFLFFFFFFTANRKCEAIISYSAERSALKGHVIDVVHARNDFACAFSCLHTNNCFSFNFKESSRVCELNHSNKMTSPEDLTIDLDYSYYELVFL